MGVRRKVFYPVAFAASLFASSAMAKVPDTAFKGISEHFLKDKSKNIDMEFYSPTLGGVALRSGLIENIRFYGSYEAAFDKNGTREYIKDTSTDSLWNVVKILFPSNNGQLGSASDAITSFGKYVKNPKTVALLVNYAKQVYDIKGKASLPGKVTQQFAADILKTLEGMGTGKSTVDNFKKTTLNPLLNHIRESIEAEKKGTSLYTKYTTVQVIQSFLCYHFNTQGEIIEELKDLDGSIVDKSRPLPTTEDHLKEADLPNIAKKLDFNLDDLFDLTQAEMFSSPTPYKSGLNLLNNGTTYFYDRANNAYIKGKTFQDCVETALRHTEQLLTFNPVLREFDSKPIEAHVEVQEKKSGIKNPYFDNFKEFSKKQTLLLANAGDIGTRSLWNTVVGNLPDTVYRKDNSNEIKSGFINLLKTVDTVFSLSLTPPPTAGLNAKKTWVVESLKAYFSALNPMYTYSVNIKASESVDELIGDALVTVADKASAEDLFSFNLDVRTAHTEINQLTVLKKQTVTDYRTDIKKHLNVIKKGTAEESLLLLASPALRQDIHPLYKLYSQPLFDNATRINFLRKLGNNYDSWKNHDSFKDNLSLIQSMVKNVLNSIGWEDYEVLTEIRPYIFTMSHMPEFQDVVLGGTKGFNLEHSDFEEIKDLFMKFKKIEFLDLADNERIQKKFFFTDDFKSLKTLNLANTHVQGFSGLENLSNLQELNLYQTSELYEITLEGPLQMLKKLNLGGSGILTTKDLFVNTPNLEEVALTRTQGLSEVVFEEPLEKLKKLSLSGSAISKLTGLQNIKNIEEIHLNNTENLSEIDFTNPLEKLKNIYLERSEISRLTGLDNLENLKELNIEKASNLTRLKFAKDNKDLVLKLKGSGIRSSADIDGFEHLDPNNVHF